MFASLLRKKNVYVVWFYFTEFIRFSWRAPKHDNNFWATWTQNWNEWFLWILHLFYKFKNIYIFLPTQHGVEWEGEEGLETAHAAFTLFPGVLDSRVTFPQYRHGPGNTLKRCLESPCKSPSSLFSVLSPFSPTTATLHLVAGPGWLTTCPLRSRPKPEACWLW